MPVIESDYRPPWPLRHGHAQTILPALLRRVRGIEYRRERLELPDSDFLDLDWLAPGHARVAVLAHGLEGSSSAHYVTGMARAFNCAGWDVVAMNFRGCSGEPNRLAHSYHAGASDDVRLVLEHAMRRGYERAGLVGFSLGGNMVLKLMGEFGSAAPRWLAGAVGISVPCHLESACDAMARRTNRPYMIRFLRCLREKLRAKQARFPVEMDDTGYAALRTFRDFDNRYTAPWNGYRNAVDYWTRCSALGFLSEIRRPTLLLNAQDDPFLSPQCFPSELAGRSEWLHLEAPPHGGHVGFIAPGKYYSERRAVCFLETGGSDAGGEKSGRSDRIRIGLSISRHFAITHERPVFIGRNACL